MPVQATKQQQSMAANTSYPDIERIYHDWDKRLRKTMLSHFWPYMLPTARSKARWYLT
jgi:hypothetical protein